MAANLTKQQIDEIQTAFDMFDKDSDGVITTEELTAVVASLGHATKESDIEDMIRQLDADNSGTVDFPEFLNMMAKKMTEDNSSDELRQAFDVFDENHDGFIRYKALSHCHRLNGIL